MWPVGQAVKTAASHAANVGSIPARVTTFSKVWRRKLLDKRGVVPYNKFVAVKAVMIVGVD